MTLRGHRTVAHTADRCVEAWAPTREECLAEAVRGLVDGLADLGGARAHRVVSRRVTAARNEDLLVAVLDEIIYGLDTEGEIPVEVSVLQAGDDTVEAVLAVTGLGDVRIVGAAPKGVSLHAARCGPEHAAGPDEGERWSCSVIIDV